MRSAPRGDTALSWLTRPVDLAGLAAFRVLFGLMMFGGALRFLANGWVDRFFVQPTHYLSYWGFEWVEVLPPAGMYALFVAMAVFAFNVAIGLFYRVSAIGFFLSFTYVELIDVSNYLNHYYLVSLLALLICFLPLNGMWSVDAKLFPSVRRQQVPAFMQYLLRVQVGCVYFYAAMAKFGPDWLLHAQPLNIWMRARIDTPILGAVLDQWWAALAMSWAGFLNDLLVVPGLLWRRTRPWAYAMVVCFHGLTSYFFAIGMFPFIMVVSATVFFDPSWPRRFVRAASSSTSSGPAARAPSWSRVGLAAALLWCTFQVFFPLRTFAYGGDVLWHEQGMRWSWRVMLREKNGSVVYRVKASSEAPEKYVYPSMYLTDHQEREMAGQPDLILRLAHDIGEEWRREGHPQVEVRVDAIASLNGRVATRLVDPEIDLMRVEDGVGSADWILPGPEGPPRRLKAASPRLARNP